MTDLATENKLGEVLLTKTRFFWYGKPDTELSREELLDIIEYLHKESEEKRKRHSHVLLGHRGINGNSNKKS